MAGLEKDLFRSVNDAALKLCCGDECLKDRLLAAIRTLEFAISHRELWPAALRGRTQEISDQLKNYDTLDSAIQAMDPSSAQRLAERILHLYADSRSVSTSNVPRTTPN